MLHLVLVLAAVSPAAADQVPPQYSFPAREQRQKGAGEHVAIATGDLDGDGFDDVVSTTANAWMKVWRGRWTGILESAGTIHVAAPAHALALGDLDADGDLDLTFAVGNKLFAALGDGGAGFATPLQIGTLKGVVSVATGDVNGDGRADVSALSQTSGRIKVFLSAPAGGFLPPISSDVAVAPTDFELGDLDGDGELDLAVADAGASGVAIAKGQGNGKFAVLGTYPGTHGSPTSVALGDLDGDGHVDFATASTHAFVLQQRFGTGDGSFGALQTCGYGGDIALADWDGDGVLDRISLLGGAQVLPGTGSCGFEVPWRLPVSSTCTSIAVLDCDGDGYPDLAYGAASEVDGPSGTGDTFTSVGVVPGYGAAGVKHIVGVPSDPLMPPTPFGEAFDIDGDGIIDVMGIVSDNSGVVLRRGTGNASFHPGEMIPFGSGVKTAAPADLDGDGDLDLVALSVWGVHTALSTGSSFLPSTQVLALPSFSYMRVADLNSDGWDDIFFVTPMGALSFLSRGNGSFARGPLSLEVEFPILAPLAIEPADLDGDPHPDLVVAGRHQGVWTYFGTGNGTFVPAGFATAGPYWSQTAVGDLDGDGLDDVLVANSDPSCLCDQKTVETLLSDGQGGLEAHGEYEVGRNIAILGLHDLNEDGALDLYAWLGADVLSTAFGNGSGGFGVARRHGASGIPIGAGDTQKAWPGYLELADLIVHPMGDLGGTLDVKIVFQF